MTIFFVLKNWPCCRAPNPYRSSRVQAPMRLRFASAMIRATPPEGAFRRLPVISFHMPCASLRQPPIWLPYWTTCLPFLWKFSPGGPEDRRPLKKKYFSGLMSLKRRE